MLEITPGPWEATHNNADIPQEEAYNITADHGKLLLATVLHAGIEWEEMEANAKAMAGAPKMKELLQGIVACGRAGDYNCLALAVNEASDFLDTLNC